MKNSEQPAMPFIEAIDGLNNHRMGLTKREYFAGLAMQGLLANSGYWKTLENGGDDYLTQCAVELADSLLKQLEK